MSFVYFVNEIRTSFVINDIKRIAAHADLVILFSVDKLEGKEELPINVIIFEEFIDWKKFSPFKIVFSNIFSILGIYYYECKELKKPLPLKKSITLLASNIYKAECVINRLKAEGYMDGVAHPLTSARRQLLSELPQSTPFYSFWFYDCIYLAWMRKKGWIEKAITRAHGGDLFEERGSLSGKVLFRNFQSSYLDKILSVSQTGTEYLQSKYPKHKHKIQTAYLGSPYNIFLNPINAGDRFVIVSCANIRNIKRIHKIAEFLQYIDFPLTWYHIGDENLEDQNDPTIPIYVENKKKLKSKMNIQFVPKGKMSNIEILRFYKEIPINLFVSLSEAEGVPVSMMEAISFGIPILSTDVGGCNEIVTKKTGVLIPLQTEMKEISRNVTDFKNSEKNSQAFRKGVREFWENHFDANKNDKLLLKYIEND